MPTLDGWRAIAILAVMGYHAQDFHLFGHSITLLHNYGSQGVDLFFAISGFLICSRLLHEDNDTGKINLGDFYLRRAFRILPPVLVFLSLIAVLGSLHVIPITLMGWLSSLLFFRNYYSAVAGFDSFYTLHFWTLSVEEHFYLLLPAVLIVCRNFRRLALGCLIVFFLIWQRIFLTGFPQRTDLHINALLLPALLAVLLFSGQVRLWFVRWMAPSVALVFFAVCALLEHRFGGDASVAYGLKPIFKLAFALVIISTVLHPQAILSRFLELSWLRWIGRLSYSLYVWQQLFFCDKRIIQPQEFAVGPLRIFQSSALSMFAVFAVATASYYWVERPAIQFGRRLLTKLATLRTDPKFITAKPMGEPPQRSTAIPDSAFPLEVN